MPNLQPPHRASPRAAIYGPAREFGRWQPTCTAWCDERRYDLVSVIDETPDATRWSDLLHAMTDGDIDIVVIASLESDLFIRRESGAWWGNHRGRIRNGRPDARYSQ